MRTISLYTRHIPSSCCRRRRATGVARPRVRATLVAQAEAIPAHARATRPNVEVARTDLSHGRTTGVARPRVRATLVAQVEATPAHAGATRPNVEVARTDLSHGRATGYAPAS
jgi:hypothetical protein